ncbi:MAG TPA: aminotransferase class V-fold PLP-dependent enzyme, partial [Casimicrobiaceae bacterium]|nr:aminotransferase class V-fold PLP-dependent enzyme [Casimicrobiaceae bacterium]
MSGSIEAAVGALGDGPLTEGAVRAHVAPLFSRVLSAQPGRVYLANHSLGRPLDATADDVREGLALWGSQLGDAWDAWNAEIGAWRARLAALMGAPRPDCVVPKTSAGQGLRAVLNAHDGVPRVVATRGEFDSLDVILREYARRGRIALAFVEPRADASFAAEDVLAAIAGGADLVVVSQVLFRTGQVLPGLAAIVAAAHAAGARLLLDVYHSLGVFPVDLAALDVDFAVGGSYKYLRGGPGACYLYLHPRHLDGRLRTLDIGWFAKAAPFRYERP